MKTLNLAKPCCYNCVYSTRVYAEVSTHFDKLEFKNIRELCYCVYKKEGKISNEKCGLYLSAYNDLKNRKREETPEDELPF